MMALSRGVLALAVAAISTQPAVATVVCEGTYEFFSGKSMVKALPGEAPENGARVAEMYNNREGWVGQVIRKPQSEGLHKVEVSQCGRQFVLTQGAKKMLFLQSVMDESIYVAQDIGTTEVELTLQVVNHKIMVGTIAGKSHGFAIDYPVAMDPRDVSMPDMEGCTNVAAPREEKPDDDRLTVDPALRSEVINIVADNLGVPREKAERYISAAMTVAKTRSSNDDPTVIAPGEGDCPEEFAGVRECLKFSSGTVTIVETNVLLDKDGRLLPVTTTGSSTNRIRVDDPSAGDLCTQGTTLPPAESRLRFKFFVIEEGGINDVQAVLADAGSDIAKSAHYADGTYKGLRGRAEAADEAYQGVGAPVTGLH